MFDILLFGAGWGGDAWLVDQVDLDRGVLDLYEYPQMWLLADLDVTKWPLPIQFCIDRYAVFGGMYLIGYAGVKPPEMEIMRTIVQSYSKSVECRGFLIGH
ncbi:hypothetical protein [Raoultella terrigena]|jgi:hypothetical protein|nr:hypothetical protein [Raoultella terrigena]VUC72847.1 Uncharacterised protein [Raoultella terrigena]